MTSIATIPYGVHRREIFSLANLVIRGENYKIVPILIGEDLHDPPIYITTELVWRVDDKGLYSQLPKLLSYLEVMRGTKGVPSRVSLDTNNIQLFINTEKTTMDLPEGTRECVSWLSTRAAVRLDLIDQSTANDIASTIAGRIQYQDLWALSRDVASLSLLDATFSTDYLSCVDTSQVVSAIQSSDLLSQGWYNSSSVWQPVFTNGVLEMVSQLGIRNEIYPVSGSALVATLASTPVLGSTVDIDLTISSDLATHTVYVRTDGQWARFDDVSNTDTITLQLPSDESRLGPTDIDLMVWDKGHAQAYELVQTTISGIITGEMAHTYFILVSPQVDISLTTSGNLYVGTNITVRVVIGVRELSTDWVGAVLMIQDGEQAERGEPDQGPTVHHGHSHGNRRSVHG